jgi:hypothetical protein
MFIREKNRRLWHFILSWCLAPLYLNPCSSPGQFCCVGYSPNDLRQILCRLYRVPWLNSLSWIRYKLFVVSWDPFVDFIIFCDSELSCILGEFLVASVVWFGRTGFGVKFLFFQLDHSRYRRKEIWNGKRGKSRDIWAASTQSRKTFVPSSSYRSQ